MLSGFTRLPSKSKTWSQRKRSSMSRRLLNLLMLSGSSEEDRKAHVERYGGYMLRAKLCVARCVTLARGAAHDVAHDAAREAGSIC